VIQVVPTRIGQPTALNGSYSKDF